DLVRSIAEAGHEVAAHGWKHERVDRMSPAQFRIDVQRCKDLLEEAAGTQVWGFRAPSFSVSRQTPWVVDILVECGYRYDASVYPVRHDRYGIPAAPRGPFWLEGVCCRILELPALTWRAAGRNWAVGGGGHFRLWPLWMLRAGLQQASRQPVPVGVLYFHPWEFDPEQPRLPLRGLARWRTYVGIKRATQRLQSLLRAFRFVTAADVVKHIWQKVLTLPRYRLDNGSDTKAFAIPQEAMTLPAIVDQH
ncbi:MAG: DUF3473 domain-containing protein, partial [Gemmataceae bacterium]|nr:DUF3473 domain-containing protein [Gemmataceae bacterium]